MSREIDEKELRTLFAEIEAPPGLDEWRERIADVHVEEHGSDEGGVVTQLRPRPRKRHSLATAAAVIAVVGLGGAVVMSRLLTDAPPTDPTMIIDGPGKTSSSPTSEPDTSGTSTTPPGTPAGPEPSWGPLTGDPAVSNTGVPRGATLRDHQGDLRITTAGQVVEDLRVSGAVIVEAPGVTLRRVVVVAPSGVPALVQLAGDLTVVDSEFVGGAALTQRASGLVVRRSTVDSGAVLTSGAEVYDSYFAESDVRVSAGASGVVLRHNVVGRVSMSDLDGPIRNVTVQDSLLTQVNAPTGPGSAGIHVLANRFLGGAPSTGWHPSAADYRWSGNVFEDTGAPAGP
ncbi:hypothetical protein [Actinophytocola algeriensis]|uniref:Phosphohistidine swiveling domain-containing protein n=1 Tax=Actinophytocola algeriensis TaxID=1768010 RepID=A0A7W7VDS0_9PSEU|nr:hypothetical protein [Actinophytocola algeriensis]MBB4906374.1 phosphohistidine swiveling domain-containing protein [Actinophytocola algeriensis]MBE1477855.1 phosphohistidine swiveling domain-containing protein [Actinophytocola algeriensis]